MPFELGAHVLKQPVRGLMRDLLAALQCFTDRPVCGIRAVLGNAGRSAVSACLPGFCAIPLLASTLLSGWGGCVALEASESAGESFREAALLKVFVTVMNSLA